MVFVSLRARFAPRDFHPDAAGTRVAAGVVAALCALVVAVTLRVGGGSGAAPGPGAELVTGGSVDACPETAGAGVDVVCDSSSRDSCTRTRVSFDFFTPVLVGATAEAEPEDELGAIGGAATTTGAVAGKPGGARLSVGSCASAAVGAVGAAGAAGVKLTLTSLVVVATDAWDDGNSCD